MINMYIDYIKAEKLKKKKDDLTIVLNEVGFIIAIDVWKNDNIIDFKKYSNLEDAKNDYRKIVEKYKNRGWK